MSLASSNHGDSVSPRRSRRLAGQPPEVDSRNGSASKASRQQSVNGKPQPPETFTNLIDAARARVERYVNGSRPQENYLHPTLNASLEWLPPGGQTSVARDIVNAGVDDQNLWQVFHDLLTGVLYPMMGESRTPPSELASPFNFTKPNLDVFAGTHVQPEARDFRDECSRRDENRCCVTGYLDLKRWKKIGRPAHELKAVVECADIIPCSYASWAGSERWEVFYKCFPRICRSRLRTPSNGMLLVDSLRDSLRMFHLAFVRTEQQNVYTIKTYPNLTSDIPPLLPDDRKVRFQCSEGAENVPLPDPEFLDCHYRVAEIINAADLSHYIWEKIQDWREMKKNSGTDGCLRADGSTDITGILNTALWPAVAE